MTTWSTREEGNCLISSGRDWLQTRSELLFVRPCYRELFELCNTMFCRGTQGIFLFGTPGIGKSCFLDYVLHRCLHDMKTVLYFDGPRGIAFLFRPNGTIQRHELSTVRHDYDGEKIKGFDYVLYDPHENAERTNDIHLDIFQGKNFIVALSPDKENCKKLRKDVRGSYKLYMGTFSLKEAEALRSSCYPHVPKDTLRKRYATIGGIARMLIQPRLPDTIDPALEEVSLDQLAALNIIADKPVIIDAGEVASQFKSLWSIYHLQPVSDADGGTDYYSYTIELCGNDARIRIRDVLMKKEVKELWGIYDTTTERQGTLRGIRYEAYAHKKILAHGIDEIATSLTTQGEGTSSKQLTIPPGLTKVTLPSSDLGTPFRNALNSARQLPDGGYLLPETSNFPVIDSLFASSNATISLQMKAGRSKPLSGTPANSIFTTAGGCLVFLVPDESIIRKKLTYSEGAGPSQLRHYRIILKESQ